MANTKPDFETMLARIADALLAHGGGREDVAAIDWLIDQPAGDLNRALISVGSGAYLWLTRTLGVDPARDEVFKALMVPTYPRQFVRTVEGDPGEASKLIYHSALAAPTTDPVQPHMFIEYQMFSPSAVVLDGGLRAAYLLIAKIATMVPFGQPGQTISSRPVDPSERGSQLDDGIQIAINEARARLGIER